MFKRVLVANRGEIAMRVIRACHELDVEAVAVYSTADRDGAWLRLADQAVCIGPPAPGLSYLDIPNVVAAAETTGCEAVHPGYGFLSENAAFVRACTDNDLVFIGPTSESMETLGDKALAKETMHAAGLPLLPGSDSRLPSVEAARTIADAAGYPLLLKAAAGGGGRGMRIVERPEQLASQFATAQAEANAAFGDGGLYLEKLVVGAHHVEVQVVGDGLGGALVLGDRECSVQRRHQKLCEEAPSPFLAPETRRRMHEASLEAVRRTRYRNAGTIEFLVSDAQEFFFMEMNTRLQVEHPVTEEVTGIDLVRLQLAIAAGEPLPLDGIAPSTGHAFEFRLNAEDPARGFTPSPGRLSRFRPPLGPGVRVDTHAYEGYVVPPTYDSLIGKLIVVDRDRPSALARAARVLAELEVEGIATTAPLFRDMLRDGPFREGRYTTAYIEQAAERFASLGATPA
jgi:acetyl-CoA carboxylase biotin carboxylase subunit